MLVDDDPMVRTGLRFLFESADDCEVVAEAGDGESAIVAVQRQSVDVVLMDLRMPGMGGVAAIAALRAMPGAPQVIALTTWDVDDAVIAALDAGAAGFLLKTSAPAEIIGGVRSVIAGDAVLSPRSARQLIDQIRRSPGSPERHAAEVALKALTQRERDVAVAIGSGLTNAEIGARLYLSPATVKSYVATLQAKLNVAGRVGIAVLAERAGLLAGD
jgi:DNA-binding NarL/FixJ family response regulator